jgi:DNA primase
MGLCPFHREQRPSLVVNDELGLYFCHGCQAGGDVIKFVMDIHRYGFLDAIRWLSGTIVTLTVKTHRDLNNRIEQARRALAVAYARFQWQEATPITGTVAEHYLRTRGIAGHLPDTLRYGRPPRWINPKTGEKRQRYDAVVAACHDADNRISGVHRIFLEPDGSIAKLRRPKLSLGAIRGGALRLAPAAAEIIVCEGLEDGLTLAALLPATPVWVALGAGNMAAMNLPDIVERVLVAGDNNKAGRYAARQACGAFKAQGRTAAPIYPDPDYEDFNDQLRDRKIAGRLTE